MARMIRTDYYYYIYDNNKDDMLWYSPSSDDKKTCDQNLLNCIEEAMRILHRNPNADISVCYKATEMCGEFEDGAEWSETLANTPEEMDALENEIRKGKK